MSINFDLGDLRACVAVAELASFRAAAETIHLSQPALSRRIEKLEDALGVRLFDRDTRNVELTAVGRDFVRKTRTLLDELDTMLLGVQDVAHGKRMFTERKCADCHAGGTHGAPQLPGQARKYSEVTIISALWHHGVRDVVLCPAVARRNARVASRTYEDEMALLVVHGILHLLGMDHADADEATAMQRRERELLGRFHKS